MGDIFWNVATSYLVLWFDGLLLLVAVVVGFFPLLRYFPVIGPYVPAARLVAVLVALVMAFLIGFRVADGREEAKNLRATIAAQQADLQNANKSVADEKLRASAIQEKADVQQQTDADYIASLKADTACDFDPYRGPRRVRQPSAARTGASRSSPGAR